MTKEEYDQKLKDIQEIEAQTGLKILRAFTHTDQKTGRITEGGFYAPGLKGTVFRQTDPFTEHSTYWYDAHLWRNIVYRDPTR